MTRRRALITGVTGMVGSHLADHLLEYTDWDIYGCCRWRSPLDNIDHLLDRANKKDRVFFCDMDLTDGFSIAAVVDECRPDYVFHLAAQSYPKVSFSSPLTTLDVNILGTERLLNVLRLNRDIDPLIHICSSSEVFGRVPEEQLPIAEENPFHPASPYAISKVGTDMLGRFHAESYGQKVLVTRMFTHTGPRRGDVFAESTFAKQIAMIECGMLPPTLKTGNLNSMRTWADVRDAVRAYHMLLTVNPIPGECYNIGGDYSCSVGAMLDHLISLSPVSDRITIVQEESRMRPLDADLQIPDTTKFRRHTGWRPEIPFETTMRELLEYWRERVRLSRGFLSR
ncbi:MAG: GDP-mannose 4,6-dehydratase [Rhodospirillales bacterium]|nr:GDP-mannose 4,6-dehydratase [Rhodospirillales bacterium]